MHFAPLATLLLASLVAGFTSTVSYDQIYDQGSTSLDEVACSNGPNGLITKGYTTFNSLPIFPHIGGVPAIGGWNSPACGTCWKLTYMSKSIFVVGIDTGKGAFNIAERAMNDLTNNQAVELGRVTVDAVQVDPSNCKM